MNKAYLIILSVIWLFFSTISYGAIPAQERAALIALYNATNGDGWANNNGWKTPPLDTDGFAMPGTEGNWYGITVVGNSVDRIYFQGNNLKGSLPPELGNLSNLQELTLRTNNLSGSIPVELGNLGNLQYLILAGNNLTGEIPSQLGNLGNLLLMSLGPNQLDGNIPSQLGNLGNLQRLLISGTQITGSIPDSLGNLANLRDLNLTFNPLSGNIPASLGNLSNLEKLHLFSNQLSGSIPYTLGNLANLIEMLLESNQLSGSIPTSLGKLSNLTLLDLGNNRLSGGIPSQFANLGILWRLHLNSNQLDGEIPSSLTALTHNMDIDIGFNCLYTADPALRAWLATRDSDWEDTQNNNCTSITIVSPNGGESWTVGSSQAITWTSHGAVGNVKIEYSTDSGSSWSTIAESTANSGTYSWAVPDTVSTDCRVKISEAADGRPSDKGDADFSILPMPQSHIIINRDKMRFTATPAGKTTPPQVAWIKNTGDDTLNWTVTEDISWLGCDPVSGVDSGIITVSVNAEGLEAGTYSGSVSISDPNADNSPQSIAVTLQVLADNQYEKPFGEFSTPIAGSTVSSSVPVTGWVLDDVGIESVKIYRGADSQSLVYIGDAVFVEGARPDVEAAYPDYPNNYKAGWGYMLLSNFFPGSGNGQFTLHAIATEIEGNTVSLGSKTITLDNANAVKPFGAIDTPEQGGTASGSKFINWGWVLTPQPNKIPFDGSGITVWVDGAIVGNPTYNIYREDIANFFPGYANSQGAIGYFYLDTSAYENGIHSIQWTATDSGGNTDGIGSRYFTIQNNGNSQSKAQTRSSQKIFTNQKFFDLSQIVDIPLNNLESIKVKRGLNDDIGFEAVISDESGVFMVKTEELERLVIDFSRKSTQINGYTVVGNQLRPLPIGSMVNSKEKKFYWQPGPGFVGHYRFVFIERCEDDLIRKKIITVDIEPKFEN